MSQNVALNTTPPYYFCVAILRAKRCLHCLLTINILNFKTKIEYLLANTHLSFNETSYDIKPVTKLLKTVTKCMQLQSQL